MSRRVSRTQRIVTSTKMIAPMTEKIQLIVVPITISVIPIALTQREERRAREVDLLADGRRLLSSSPIGRFVAHGWT